MYTHLLVPVDGTELSERAAAQSLALARKLGAKVTAFVSEPTAPLPTMSSNMASFRREMEAHDMRATEHARRTLDRFAAQAAEAAVPFEGKYAQADSVDEAIVRTAEECGCDLIVMVTHGRGAFGELLFGSHTKGVLARSKLPLLVLH